MPETTNTRGRCRTAILEDAQKKLFQLEDEGMFSTLPLRPESEFPTFLTRLPIFRPCKRSNQRELLDNDNAMRFSTPWGHGKRHGPPLTIYDEDTLIAIGRLRQSRLSGKPSKLPFPVTDIYNSQSQEEVHVHVVHCMLSDIQEMCDATRGGAADQMRLDSIKRLAATVIEFDNKTAARFIGSGTMVKLIDVLWQKYYDNAVLYIQFTPIVAHWYENEYTYINWALRCLLTDTGKAIHRFLAGQPRKYEIFSKKLMETIGYMRGHNKFLVDLRYTLKQMEEAGWVKSWEIVGTGRLTPHKLCITRVYPYVNSA